MSFILEKDKKQKWNGKSIYIHKYILYNNREN